MKAGQYCEFLSRKTWGKVDGVTLQKVVKQQEAGSVSAKRCGGWKRKQAEQLRTSKKLPEAKDTRGRVLICP